MTNEHRTWIGAAVATLIALITYTLTMAPTMSWWDCGEYIAAAQALGVPHPPGAPLHSLVGRVFLMGAVFFEDPGARVNFLSALSAAIAVGFAFLILARVTVMLQGAEEARKMPWVRLVSAMSGSLLLTFSDTYWFSAVEAEVYGLSMMLLMATLWLTLEWTPRRHTPMGDRLLALVAYIAILGVTVHLYSTLFLPLLLLYVLWVDKDRYLTVEGWPVWIAGAALGSVVLVGSKFPFIIGGTALFLVTMLVILKGSARATANLRLGAMVAFMGMVGWSSYLYIPIRSALDPVMDQGDPEIRPPLRLDDPSTRSNLQRTPSWQDAFDLGNWREFRAYLDREQYGTESMFTRAFVRRGNPWNQLLVHDHMGYGGYMLAQLTPWKVVHPNEFLGFEVPPIKATIGVSSAPDPQTGRFQQEDGWAGRRLLQLIFFVLLHLPLWWLVRATFRRERAVVGLLTGLYLASSIGIVFYMNFADGTRPETHMQRDYREQIRAGNQVRWPGPVHMEVRERDYFFSPAFMLMAMLYGLGLGWLARNSFRRTEGGPEWYRQWRPAGAAMLGILILPAFVLASNGPRHDRSGNWVPWDYAFNLLNSCLPDGILFTNGDNDTFPLWYLQDVAGIRRDVKVINLSLLNTDWYIRQMRDIEPRVPIDFSDLEIAQLQPIGNPHDQPVTIPVGRRMIQIPNRSAKSFFAVQDKMVLHIAELNDRRPRPRPIHFASTMPESNMMGLQDYAVLTGMVYTIADSITNRSVDLERTHHLFRDVYRFRGINDPNISLDDDSRRIVGNYAMLAIQATVMGSQGLSHLVAQASSDTADSFSKAAAVKSLDSARALVNGILNVVAKALPPQSQIAAIGAQSFLLLGDTPRAESILGAGMEAFGPDPAIALQRAQLMSTRGLDSQALAVLREALSAHPRNIDLTIQVVQFLFQRGQLIEARDLLQTAINLEPANQQVRQIAQYLDAMIQMQNPGLAQGPGAALQIPQAPTGADTAP